MREIFWRTVILFSRLGGINILDLRTTLNLTELKQWLIDVFICSVSFREGLPIHSNFKYTNHFSSPNFDSVEICWRLIGLVGRVFANKPEHLGSIPGCVIPKTLKMVLDNSLFNTQQYKVRIEGKMEQSRKRSTPSPTPRWSSYWKGSLQAILDYSRQLYLLIFNGVGDYILAVSIFQQASL